MKYVSTLSKAKGLRLRSDLSMLLGAGGAGSRKSVAYPGSIGLWPRPLIVLDTRYPFI